MSRNWMIDFDGVIADLSGAMIRSCNEKFGTEYADGDEASWNWWREQPRAFEEFVWHQCYPSKTWFLSEVQPYEGALEALADLLTDPLLAESVMIVTARPESHKDRILTWMSNQNIPLITKIPIVCAGKTKKSAICAKHMLDTVVEDGVHNLEEMNSHSMSLFLVDRPWNRDADIDKATRVSGLQGAVDHVAKEALVAA